MDNIVQSSIQCPGCGSWYRGLNTCKCGTQVAEPKKKERVIRQPLAHKVGKMWNKNLHRYLTEKEIKAGMKGG